MANLPPGLHSRSSTSLEQSSVDGSASRWLADLRRHVQRSPKDHLRSGDHLERFFKYLSRPAEESSVQHAGLEDTESNPYAVLYDFQSPELRRDLSKPSDLKAIAAPTRGLEGQSQLLFMRGYPSPTWLSAIGSAFGVEASFFYHHLEQFSRSSVDTAHTWPPLLAHGRIQSRFSIRTLGRLNHYNKSTVTKQAYVRSLRRSVEDTFAMYLPLVQKERDIVVGDSLLRDVAVHDGVHFSFGQDMSIWTEQHCNGWLAIVWLDVGLRDLSVGPYGPKWLAPLGGNPNTTLFSPTVIDHESDRVPGPFSAQESKNVVRQNAKHLWNESALGIDRGLAQEDMVYALSTVLGFAAESNNQFLNMLNSISHDDIRRGTVSEYGRTDAALSNLASNCEALRVHVKQLRQNVQVLERWTAHSATKRRSSGHAELTCESSRTILENFRELLRRAESLAAECDVGIRRVVQVISHAELQQQMDQNERVARLTQSAFVFVPATFTASFFGMNFMELGQGRQPIWIYFAVTVPVVVMALLFMTPGQWLRVHVSRAGLQVGSKLSEHSKRSRGDTDIEMR